MTGYVIGFFAGCTFMWCVVLCLAAHAPHEKAVFVKPACYRSVT